jgi:prepilin-type N-terminal cleavage/methylation domain-containing protein
MTMDQPQRRAARGFTLVEMMISSAILLAAITGFIATVQHVVASNALSHRRTVGSFARGALLDQLAVMPRRVIGEMPQGVWFIDECYDLESRLVGSNVLRDVDFACPDPASYQRWLRVEAVAGAPTSFRVGLYVERINAGCTLATDHQVNWRDSSSNCVSGDAFIND